MEIFMSNGPVGDPFFPGPPAVPPAPGHPQHPKHHDAAHDWVVIHRGGEGSKAHVQSLEHKLVKAKIPARVEHDDERRVVLEVPREHEAEARKVIGLDQVSGVGEKAHQTGEERMEAEERAELTGPFKASTTRWVLIVVAIAVVSLLALWMLPYITR
jgi:hypothetical protein